MRQSGSLVIGLVVGASLGAGGLWLVGRGQDGCGGRCGTGTRCEHGTCLSAATGTAQDSAPRDPKRRRGGSAHARAAQGELKLQPGDEATRAEGDALGRPEHITFAPGESDPASSKELSQDDIDRVFDPGNPQISRCITEAVGDYPLERGKVKVGVRIDGSGAVTKVRVEAPQLLLRQGLYRCVRSVATGLRFPASGGATVVSYDFELR